MKTIVKNALVVALIVAGTSIFAQERKGEKGKEKMESIINELGLSADQAEKVKTIFKEEMEVRKTENATRAEMEKLSDEDKRIAMAKRKLKMAEAGKATNVKLKEVLTEEQMEKYTALKKQKMEKRKEFRKERMEHKPQKEDMHQEEPEDSND
ncbi:MAG: Spy/CpxP family protein refolding chaperone [Vicingaceae bacterium]|jgi:Spy/CpxP family protein refolding chaperone